MRKGADPAGSAPFRIPGLWASGEALPEGSSSQSARGPGFSAYSRPSFNLGSDTRGRRSAVHLSTGGSRGPARNPAPQHDPFPFGPARHHAREEGDAGAVPDSAPGGAGRAGAGDLAGGAGGGG